MWSQASLVAETSLVHPATVQLPADTCVDVCVSQRVYCTCWASGRQVQTPSVELIYHLFTAFPLLPSHNRFISHAPGQTVAITLRYDTITKTKTPVEEVSTLTALRTHRAALLDGRSSTARCPNLPGKLKPSSSDLFYPTHPPPSQPASPTALRHAPPARCRPS